MSYTLLSKPTLPIKANDFVRRFCVCLDFEMWVCRFLSIDYTVNYKNLFDSLLEYMKEEDVLSHIYKLLLLCALSELKNMNN